MGTRREGSPIPSGNRKRFKYTKKRRIIDDKNSTEQRLFSSEDCSENINFSRKTKVTDITSFPVEILLKIMSYLGPQDLYALRGVSKFFESLVLEPSLWTAYEVSNNGPDTSDVIDELKRMPHLKTISIKARNDCDDILRQLSCSNKRLQTLRVINCTASSESTERPSSDGKSKEKLEMDA